MKENFVFLCNGTSFEIIEILNSERVLSLSKYPLPSEQTNIIVIDDYAYIVIENEGIIVLDIKDKRFPKPIGKFETAVRISGFFNYEKLLYLNMDGKVLKILDISNPLKFVKIGNIYESRRIDFLIKGDYAYCINHFEGLKIFDIKNPRKPKLKSSKEFRPMAQIAKSEKEREQTLPIFLEIDKFIREFAEKHFKPKNNKI